MSDETNAVKHTPEPWIAEPYRADSSGLTDCGIVSIPRPGHGFAVFRAPRFAKRKQWEADSVRAVACVNACKGINPEAVPKLLAALKGLRDQQFRMIESGGADGPLSQDLIESFARSNAVLWAHAEAAITEAEGGAE
jgi:hypothetical protein